jgi:catechol 2,3-dioxygenase-like lactoylglutathione lyase family enzyme
MIVGLHHTAISTPDLERSVGFYRDLLGFAVEFEFAWDEANANFQRTHAVRESAGRVAMLAREGARLEIFEYRKPAPRPQRGAPGNADHGLCHFCIQVEDIDDEFARLKQAGMEFQSEPVPQGNVKCCYGRDPDGNLIELIEYFDHVVEGGA